MNPFKLFGPLFQVFKKGEEVQHAEVVKAGAAAGSAIGGLILAIAALLRAAGLDWLPPIDDSTALLWGTAAGSIYAFGVSIVTVITTRRIGLGTSGSKPDEPAVEEKESGK